MALTALEKWETGYVKDLDGRLSVVQTTVAGATSTATSGTTATVTSVAGSASNVTLLSSSSSRVGVTVFNESTATLYLKYGATASTSSYTVQIGPNGYWEMPSGSRYTGQIDGIWSAANGNARITSVGP